MFLFSVKRGGAKTELILNLFSVPRGNRRVTMIPLSPGQIPPGCPVLRLNLDKTSVRFRYEPRQGLRRPTGPVPRADFARQASRVQLRRAFSHIALVCGDASLQPHRPQVLLVSERAVTTEQHQRWASLPGCDAT